MSGGPDANKNFHTGGKGEKKKPKGTVLGANQ